MGIPSIAYLLKTNEVVIWHGKPVFTPFVLSSISVVLFGLIWLIIPISIFTTLRTQPATENIFGKIGFQIFLIPFFALGVIMLLAPFYNILVHRFVEYIITSQRVIVIGGLIGRDIKVFEFNRIKNFTVEVNLIDKIYGTGKIKFFTGEIESSSRSASTRYDTFYAIQRPYEVFKIVQDAIDRHEKLRNKM